MAVGAQLPDASEPNSTRSEQVAWAARALRRQEMPSEEISAIFTAEDPAIVHIYMELHRERLQEQLGDRLRMLDRLERILTGTVAGSTHSHP